MADLNELDCKIHVEAPWTPEAIAGLLSRALGGQVSVSPSAQVVLLPSAEIEIRENEDADSRRAADFPDGFLYFRYILEVYPVPTSSRQDRVSLAARVLELCWSQGWPAVAACDYESELPQRGGYNNPAVPWLTQGAEAEEAIPKRPA
ncbi:MAG TPA: hypothetical protein VG013_31130 [Gemmataceae bacterium]|nr:hypothetical protein [Gemmataceae bacterium]